MQSEPRVLTHMGYAIRKDSLTPQELQAVRKELRVAPVGKFVKQDPFNIYVESSQRLYMPPMWGMERFGPCPSILVDGDPLRQLEFVGKPYDYQVEIINTFVEKPNGLICVPCGRGKTFMAIAIAHKLGRRFMIVVDKEFLLQQWRGELEALLPGIRIGILQESKKEIDADCCIAMIQTLVSRSFAETEFRGFGFTIFDECHHLGAAHFSRALLKVQTKKMLGLSAWTHQGLRSLPREARVLGKAARGRPRGSREKDRVYERRSCLS